MGAIEVYSKSIRCLLLLVLLLLLLRRLLFVFVALRFCVTVFFLLFDPGLVR